MGKNRHMPNTYKDFSVLDPPSYKTKKCAHCLEKNCICRICRKCGKREENCNCCNVCNKKECICCDGCGYLECKCRKLSDSWDSD